MARISDEDKSARKERIRLIIRRENGIRESEIVDQVGFGQRTVNNYLRELEYEGKIFKKGVLWYEQDFAETELRRFALSAEETLTLYILVRLFVKQTDKRNEIAEQLLVRLAEVLKNEEIVHADILEASKELAGREEKVGFLKIYRTVLRGYLFRRRLKIVYQPLNAELFETELEIYLIEPSSFGYATYLIGYSGKHGKVWTYKLERVISAEILPQKYDIPIDFPGLDYLRNAWSIYGGEKTVRVKLRFSERVKARVLESNWHFSQEYDDEQPDGSLLWWVDVADTTDIFPWIRQWGGDVEILEPDKLQRAMRVHVRRLAESYDLTTDIHKLPYQLLYAKTDRATGQQVHQLLHHLIDVGQVAKQLWENVLGASFRAHIATLLGLNEEEAGRLCAFLAALHDLGKAGPVYQAKYAPDWLKKKLGKMGLNVRDTNLLTVPTQHAAHGTVTAWALPKLLQEYGGFDPHSAQKIALTLGGHHGVWEKPSKLIRDSDAWDSCRRDLYWELRGVFQPPRWRENLPQEALNTFCMLLLGLTSVADWIGSRENHFPFVEEVLPTRVYAEISADQAANALKDLGWLGWQPTGETRTFEQLFAYLDPSKTIKPHLVQQEVIDAARDRQLPALLILENVTGGGKTEVATYLADNWLQRTHGRGFYVAMPTQATSNQMHDRMTRFLEHRYSKMLVNVPLVHGQAAYDARMQNIALHRVEDDSQGVAALNWFTEQRKRTLLAPFGVGTVDQTLLSILQTRHFFVRLFALSHKVVIFDEVHAYDTFMSTLFDRLLGWLRAVGTSVIILSATLPQATRRRLVAAYSSVEPPDITDFYPALTLASADQPAKTIQLTAPDDVSLNIAWKSLPDPSAIAAFAFEQVKEGGCMAIICNTVTEAQEIFKVIWHERAQHFIEAEDLILFHARFPPAWRTQIEEAILGKFSKRGKRPKRAIVVATQVIEQSLDLDFDIMLSALAPIDLLIQRAGRLHRHDRGERRHPRCLSLIQPSLQEGLPDFGTHEYVYARYVLLRTYLALHERTAVTLPKETVQLIESVYGEEAGEISAEYAPALQAAYTDLQEAQRVAYAKAARQLIHQPTDRKLLMKTLDGLEEDNPSVHEAFQAQTRDIRQGIMLICLELRDDEVLLPSGAPIALDAEIDDTLLSDMLQYRLNVQHWSVVKHCLNVREESGSADAMTLQLLDLFKQNAALRYYHPLLFVNGHYSFTSNETEWKLTLTEIYGLEIIKEKSPITGRENDSC